MARSKSIRETPWVKRQHLYLAEGETLEDEATRQALQAIYPVIHFADGSVLLGKQPA